MWKTVVSTFFLVFIAELGDKTQLSTMLLASRSRSIWSVFLGSAAALVLSSLIGVCLGSLLCRYIPEIYIKYASSIAFIIIGILMLFEKA